MSSIDHRSNADRDIAQVIFSAIDALKTGSGFGAIEIAIHEGHVTQIEKREKLRFNLTTNQDQQKPTTNVAVK